MNPTYPQLEPREVFRFFAEISRIPRESGHEEGIAAYLEAFAKDRGLSVTRDKVNNVIIRKPGTAGRESLPPLILQGHMDMVCVAGPGVQHDFRKDPITWRVEGDMLYANGTTLGGDNGIAVAYALAILDSKDIPHPPLEVLITTSEETGMDGANGVDPKELKGRVMLNIDSEEEGVFLTSCAGGANMHLTRFYETVPAKGLAYRLHIGGLLSGHSGMEIIKQRANAIQLLARCLYELRDLEGWTLASISGGTKHNAIAAASTALLVFENEKIAGEAGRRLAEMKKVFHTECKVNDPGIDLSWNSEELPAEMYCPEDSKIFVHFLYMLPHGVIEMNPELPGLVRTSLNLGILHDMAGMVELTISVRSSLASQKHFVLNRLAELARLFGAQAEIRSDYPAWEYEEHSPLRDLALRVHKEMTGKEAEVTAIHAGLECGILRDKMPGCDCLSCGPDLFDVHTSQEHMSLPSVARLWKFLLKLLEAYPG